MTFLSEGEVAAALKSYIEEAGGLIQAARKLGITKQALSRMGKDDRSVSRGVALKLGYVKRNTYHKATST